MIILALSLLIFKQLIKFLFVTTKVLKLIIMPNDLDINKKVKVFFKLIKEG